MEKYIVTIFGIGYFKLAPGTLGSIFGVVFFYYFYNLFSNNFSLFLIFIFLIFIAGWYFTCIYVFKNKIHDPKEIIIDEFLGQLISLTPLLFLYYFEIEKPWPIYIIDNHKTSLSILLDDILAGLFSSIFLLIYLIWI